MGNTTNGIQETVIDFYVVCDKVLPLVIRMTIYEQGQNSLTKYKGKIMRTKKRSMTNQMHLMLEINSVKKSSLSTHQTLTCLQSALNQTSKHIEQKFKTWQSKFKKALCACFKIVRVTEFEQKPTYIDSLMNQKKDLLKQKKTKSAIWFCRSL